MKTYKVRMKGDYSWEVAEGPEDPEAPNNSVVLEVYPDGTWWLRDMRLSGVALGDVEELLRFCAKLPH